MRAAYDMIYHDIRDSIEQGFYSYRDFLPSEGFLTQKYGCAHNTVRKALSILAEEGYIQSIHGKGVRVLYHSTPLLTTNVHAFAQAGFEPLGFNPLTVHESEVITRSVLRMEDFDYDQEFAEKTGFSRGGSCVLIERLHSIDGTPIERETSYVRSDAVRGITEEEATEPLVNCIEANGGRIVTVKESFTVSKASARDCEVLNLSPDDYVIVITQAFFDHEGLLCKFSELSRIPSAFAYLHTRIHSKLD